MRKVQVFGVMLLVLFALSTLTATSASAAFLLAEWLVGGVAVTTELATETAGELKFEDTKVPIIGKAAVLCSLAFDGWTGQNSLDHISEVLTLEKVAISNTPLSGESLNCTAQTGCETNTVVLLWPTGFPAETEVELFEQESVIRFADLIHPAGGKFGFEITNCLVLGTAMTDECTTPEEASELTLEGTTLLWHFTEAFTELAGLTLTTCTQGGANSGVTEGEGAFALTGGGELTASSETSTS